MRELKEREEYERETGEGSVFCFLTNGCFSQNGLNKRKYVHTSKIVLDFFDLI